MNRRIPARSKSPFQRGKPNNLGPYSPDKVISKFKFHAKTIAICKQASLLLNSHFVNLSVKQATYRDPDPASQSACV